MMGGIDQLVKQKMNSTRARPQGQQGGMPPQGQPQGQGQKGYQMPPDLIEALAMQKLKTEKEQAAQEMQMQMNPESQTIAQQRQGQVMDLTKNEITKGIGDTLRQQESQRRANMQKMANQGIGGIPRTPVRMAQGGLVSFSEGTTEGTVGDTVREGHIKRLMEEKDVTREEAMAILGLPASENKYRPDPIRRGAGANANPMEKPTQTVTDRRTGETREVTDLDALLFGGNNINPTGGQMGRNNPPPPLAPQGIQGALPPQAQVPYAGGMGEAFNPANPAANPDPMTTPPTIPSVGGNVGADTLRGDPATSGIMANVPPAENSLADAAAQFSKDRMAVNPDLLAQERASQREIDMRGERAAAAQMHKDDQARRGVQTKQQDPQKLARERLINTFLGMGNQSSGAGALGGAGIASQLTRAQQEERARKNADSNFTASGILQGVENTYGQGQNEAHTKGYDSGIAQQDKGLQGATSIMNTEVLKEQNRIAQMTNHLVKTQQLSAKKHAEVRLAQDSVNELLSKYQNAFSEDMQYTTALMAFTNAKGDKEKEKAARDMQRAQARVAADMDLQGQMAAQRAFLERMYQEAGWEIPPPISVGGGGSGGVVKWTKDASGNPVPSQ